jgi:hypothetical protein
MEIFVLSLENIFNNDNQKINKTYTITVVLYVFIESMLSTTLVGPD